MVCILVFENEASVTKLASPTNQILVPAHPINPPYNPKNPKSHLKIRNRNQQIPPLKLGGGAHYGVPFW